MLLFFSSVYKYISLLPRLNAKEPNLSDIKVIALNRRTWMSVLSSQVYESAFSSLLENTDYGQGNVYPILLF